jgi:cytochrome c oxidase assembly protein subunit 15
MAHNDRRQAVAAGVSCGFAAAAACFVAAWTTHLPWLELSAQVAGPIILGVWVLAAIIMGRRLPRSLAPIGGLFAGLSAALFLLIPLGSALVQQPSGDTPAPGASGMSAQTLIRAGGFIALGAVIGTVGTLIGSRVVNAEPSNARRWLPRFAACLAVATLPLILVGGLVTSTNSGMAFRDWPTSDGANLFLYPLSLLARPDRFLEHSHRLFGSFIGLGTVVLMTFTLLTERSARLRAGAVALLIAVIVQGLLGGTRVTEDSMALRIVHGYVAHIFFACLVGFTIILSPAWNAPPPPARDASLRKLKFLSTMALHACLLQHLLGAMYRHMKFGGSKGTSHILYTHAALALVVFVVAFLAVTVSGPASQAAGAMSRSLKRTGGLVGAAVTIQFLLGWGAFFAVTGDKGALTDPSPMTTALATAHQANGALLLASLAGLWLLTRHAWKRAPEG